MHKSLLFLRLLAGLLVVEAVALLWPAAILLAELFGGGSGSVAVSIFLVLFLLGVAWALVAAARSLLAGRRRARGLVMTWQLFQVLIGAWLIALGITFTLVLGVVAILVAAAVVVLLLSPPVVEATTRR